MAAVPPRLRILLLCDDNRTHANTMLDHITSFQKYSRHRVSLFNPRRSTQGRTLNFNEFDVVVVHWSLSLIHDHYLHTKFRDRLSRFPGLKVQLIQDDYRWVDRITAEQRRVGINVLFTLVREEHFDKIWTPRLPGVRLVTTLPGYVPQELVDRPFKPLRERELDIVYRGREVPWWLGRLGQDKVLVGRGVKERAEGAGLKVDIAWTEGDRIYGDRWIEFLSNSRTTIGCEGGASITDFDGSIESRVVEYRRAHPAATFDEVHAAVLQPDEDNVPMNLMTPRLFEAAALRTALVLFPGDYSDVLVPGRHYIPLEKDFSNFDEVARLIRDDDVLEELTARTYLEIAKSGKYGLQAFIGEFDRVIDEEGVRRAKGPMLGFGLVVAERQAAKVIKAQRVASVASATVGRLLGLPHRHVTRHPKDYAAKAYLALRATFRSRDRAALLGASLLPRRNDGNVGLDVRLEDMLKIDILRQAQRGQLTAGHIFRTWPHLHADGVLELRSALIGETDPDAVDAEDAVRALEDGSVVEIAWNHAAVANAAYHALPRKGFVTVSLGSDGRHEFPWIRQLLLRDRRAATRIIKPTLVGPSQSHAKPGRRFASSPAGYSARVYLALRAIAPNRGYRRMLNRYLRNPKLRSAARIDQLLADLLKLDLLRTTCADPNGVSVHLRRNPENGHWTYVTEPGASGPSSQTEATSVSPPAKVTWDHSAVSRWLVVPLGLGKNLTVWLGSAGTYEFSALSALALQDPALVISVLPIPGRQGAPRSPSA